MKRVFMKNLFLAAVAATAFISCTNDDENPAVPPAEGVRPYVIAATVTMSNNSTPVLLTTESLEHGTVSPVNQGLVTDAASYWVFHGTDYLYGLSYNQGNAGLTRSFVMVFCISILTVKKFVVAL